VLLEKGALEVLAVDVGRGQLEPELRDDPRVRLLERVDWKRLPPSIEPGPFDVFAVDVSFVAARNMLRGLAFRLRPGARGVVLVKPQFELPEGSLAPGQPGDAALRVKALERFRTKAKQLGFAVVEAIESPVPGASGTIEILAHVRFDGWDAKPSPAPPGDRTAAEVQETAAEPHDASLRWFAIASPGLEPVLEAEVRALSGVSDVQPIEGGVGFAGSLAAGMSANLWLRTATRVLARAGNFRAEDFASFRRRAAQLDWAPFLTPETPVEVQVTAHRCKLFHSDAVRENVEHAIRDWARKARFSSAGRGSPQPSGTPAPIRVLVRGSQNRWTFSVDSSGALLHLRGWRTETARAPLRETLAAGLIALCGWDGTTPFVDPMCGSGTFVVEAAAMAIARAPGLDRTFAFETWPSFDARAWDELRAGAREHERSSPASPITGYDRDPAAVRVARRNAERARLAEHLSLHQGDLAKVRPPPSTGLVLVNPPYGRRIENPREARARMRELGRVLRDRFRGWHGGVLLPDASWARDLGIEPVRTTALRNGGLRVHLIQLDL